MPLPQRTRLTRRASSWRRAATRVKNFSHRAPAGNWSAAAPKAAGPFRPGVKLDSSQVKDLRGKTMIRGRTLVRRKVNNYSR